LHIENFGTWRDAEGRLAWGINDFDEAHALPYTNDLLRLAVSAHLGIAANHLALLPEDACDAIMEGYTAGLEAGGSPFVLAEQRPRLRDMVASEKRDPAGYWKKFDSLPTITEVLPASAKKALEAVLPDNKMDYRVAHRTAGLGSLGRQRFLAIGEWRGGKIAREAKALVPSACTWAGNKASHQSMQLKALNQAVRSHDPFITVQDGWIVRRLAPDCSRIELGALSRDRDEYRLLRAMGRETANVHLGSRKAISSVVEDLKRRSSRWLHTYAQEMVQVTKRDWRQWKSPR